MADTYPLDSMVLRQIPYGRRRASVKDRDLTAPPGSPSEGDRYIVATGGSGAWSGHDLEIAEWHAVGDAADGDQSGERLAEEAEQREAGRVRDAESPDADDVLTAPLHEDGGTERPHVHAQGCGEDQNGRPVASQAFSQAQGHWRSIRETDSACMQTHLSAGALGARR